MKIKAALNETALIFAELLPELRSRWNSDDEWLYHPLVHREVYNLEDAIRANNRFQKKEQRVRELRNNPGDGYDYVFLHEKPYRFDALDRIAPRLSDTDYWGLVKETWVDSENIFRNLAGWQRLWSAPRNNKHKCMTPKERRALKAMSSSFQVWRGVGHRGRVQGLSWTLDRDKAIWFARRFSPPGSCRLIHGAVKRNSVHAFFQRRKESEIVASDVDVVKVEKLKGGI